MGRLFINDIGLDIIVSTCVDLSSMTSSCIMMRKPSESTVAWSASLSGSASLGMIKYTTTASSDLDESGKWLGYARIAISSDIHTGETFEVRFWNPWER